MATDTTSPSKAAVDGTEGLERESAPKSASDAVSDIEKKMLRAERFGITVKLSEEEKRSSRAERFGTTAVPKPSEALKRKARAERFGMSAVTDDEAKKIARRERFSTVSETEKKVEEDKKKARAARFAKVPVSSISVNGKEHAVMNATVAGNASGGS